jgi:LmbE family N-acetylglucosaminyl deacetylase
VSVTRDLYKYLSRRPVLLALAVVLAVLGMLSLAEGRRLRGLYWYEVGADQNYRFSQARTCSVVLTDDGFVWPDSAGTASTALLALDVDATLGGQWFEPVVEILIDGSPRTVQMLERGAHGRRYLNLGQHSGRVGKVTLRGRYLSWPEQRAELLLFDAPPLHSGPVLVLAPHPDDAEIAAFGLYSSTDPWVVTVSAGNNVDRRMAHLEAGAAARSGLKGELRAWDSVAIPRWGGVKEGRAVNLGYFNQSLAGLYQSPREVVADPVLDNPNILRFRDVGGSEMLANRDPESNWQSLVEDLIAVLEFVEPVTIVTPHPALDAAPDHKLTTVALIEALGRVGFSGRTLLLYTNHATGAEYFPFGPADAVISLPPWPGKALHADGVFSMALDDDRRLRKLYALEAQHDLRAAPRFVGTSPIRRVAGEVGRALTRIWRDPTDTYSYMRRGPRPNELFLVRSEENADALLTEIEEFLADARAGKIGVAAY